MKKVVLTMSLLAIAAAAQAQSSVTLYGRIDNGIQYENGLPQGHKISAESGDWGCSWFGMQGAEDIGGGTQVIFQLEGQLNTQNGQSAGALFGRHATIGFTNGNYGTFKLGNLGAGELSQDSWGVDPQVMQRYAISTLVRGRNWASAANGFEYTSPNFFGLTLKGQYDITNNYNWNSAGTGAGTGSTVGSAQGRTDGIEAVYDIGALELRGIYDEVRSANGTFDNVYTHSRSALGGGTYTLGPVKFYAGYQHLNAPQATDASMGFAGGLPAGTTAPTSVDHEWFGVAWQATAAAALTGAIFHANANNGNGNATMYTLAATYNLSKRTFLYTEFGYIHNSSTSNVDLGNDAFGPNTNQSVSPNASTTNPNYGHSQTGVFAGIMTGF
ncbi:porin [Pararobbsia alpina]|uniref:Outer membrane porin protein n=1 Tax=Pararobbsia alpina TaxID=621374 RepID=A0A6S7B4F3_9BURK|nr:porin [Pararobbsia alpina]CAB3779088.1 Outer membrane porin protein [Pararobbsia alpina]